MWGSLAAIPTDPYHISLLQRLVEEIESKEPEKNAVVRQSRNVQSTLNVCLGFPMQHSLIINSPERSQLILLFLL